MKRYIALALVLALSLSVAGCAAQTATPSNEAPSTEIRDIPSSQPGFDWGITLTLKDLTPSGATLVCTQSGGTPTGELNTGSYYVIQRLTGDGWESLEYLELEGELAWTAIAYLVNPNGITEWEVNWAWLYGELPGGTYRIGKEFMDFRGPGDYDEMLIYAEFEIE